MYAAIIITYIYDHNLIRHSPIRSFQFRYNKCWEVIFLLKRNYFGSILDIEIANLYSQVSLSVLVFTVHVFVLVKYFNRY